jgi:hypothetical protein
VSKTKKKKKSKPTPEIHMWVRDSKTRAKIGVVVAQKRGKTITLGWSQCMTKPSRGMREQGIVPDVFDKTTGQNKARARAANNRITVDKDGNATVTQNLGDKTQIPNRCVAAMRQLGKRARKYFQKK